MGRFGTIKYYGGDEIIQRLDKAGANVEEALGTALLNSAEPIKVELLEFIKKHKCTRETEDTFVTEVKTDLNNKLYCYVGFNLKKEDGKPGLPALFLNYGTPIQDATYFIDNAIERNLNNIKKIQIETLEKILCGKS